jgi:DNA-binding NarL/FixJ family response regulator
MEVLRLIAQGLTYQQIAATLVISVNTVRFYIKAIYSKLLVNSRTQAVAAAHQIGLL